MKKFFIDSRKSILLWETEKDLIERIKALGKIDHDIKFGLIDKRVALEMFILDSNDSVTKKG